MDKNLIRKAIKDAFIEAKKFSNWDDSYPEMFADRWVRENINKIKLPKWLTNEKFQSINNIYNNDSKLQGVKALYDLSKEYNTGLGLKWAKDFLEDANR